jgi:predicted MFS family arabinose efflux permease
MSNPRLVAPTVPDPPSFALVCGAGFVALAIAMGIGRFAFTPLLPLMAHAGSVDVAMGGALAAANYAGYWVGALSSARVPLGPQRLTVMALLAIAASTAAMGATASVAVWLLLRFGAGGASAWVLVSTSVWCLGWIAALARPAGAGLLYAGVGAGIALAGLWCWQGGIAGIAPDRLWRQLGALALLGLALVAACMPRRLAGEGAAVERRPPANSKGQDRGLVICYGILGFGYILPATFLPVLARDVTADAAVFGAAWPVFGAAAAVSTLLAAMLLARASRRRLLAGSHVLMAIGCGLPVLHLSLPTELAASLLVGGTFMVATMAGMQAAREGAHGDPTRALGRMTAAFAIGQMSGPLLSSLLGSGTVGTAGLMAALGIGAVALLASAVWLWRSRS